jgi:O6-methylguanine-DNA--protein-cysteine methyltransferase
VSPDLLGALRRAAELAQLPVSSWMRDRLGRAARREIRAAEMIGGGLEEANPKKEESAMKYSAPSGPVVEKWIARVRKEIEVGDSGEEISAVRMLRGGGGAKHDESALGGAGEISRRALKEIDEYLGGGRKTFDLAVDLSALTPFSRDVLRATERIPYGETRSYKWVAAEAGRPRAVRAVGGALHRNPVPLLIP